MTVATQPPVLSKKTGVGTTGKQLITAADLASGFLADANADDEATMYRLIVRASGAGFMGADGHEAGGGGANDYDELLKIDTDDYEYPDLVRRTDLTLFYGYATTNREFYVRCCKVVAP